MLCCREQNAIRTQIITEDDVDWTYEKDQEVGLILNANSEVNTQLVKLKGILDTK